MTTQSTAEHDLNLEEQSLRARDLVRKGIEQDGARGGSAACPTPHTVEWRTRSSSTKKTFSTPRAAVCFAGVSRFIDWTRGSIETRFLPSIGLPHDLFTYATPGWRLSAELQAGVCEQFLEVQTHDTNGMVASTELQGLLANATPATNEGAALQQFAVQAVAGRIDWDEQSQDFLNGSQMWWRALRRPGGWLGGVRDARGKMRPSAGLHQLRALQWCADAVRWHEQAVLGFEYGYLLFARWDMHWLLPLPSVPLLQSMQPSAVWVTSTQSENYANDRFAVVPRRHLSAYFEGWKLLVSGEVDKAFEAILPRTGVPVYDAEPASTEAFVYLRLTYAKVLMAWLPPLAYVQCVPTSDLRTHGHSSCTPFSKVIDERGADMLTGIYAGAKYPREVSATLLTEYIWHNRLYVDTAQIHRNAFKPQESQWARILRGEFEPWNEEAVNRCSQAAVEAEVDTQLGKGACMFAESHISGRGFIFTPGGHSCRQLMLNALKIGLYDDALSLARAAVLVEPLNLDNWIWLIGFLSNPPIDKHHASYAALLEARKLSPGHRMQSHVDPTSVSDPSALDEALGGPNVTRLLVRYRRRHQWALGLRRRLQQACAALPASSLQGFQAWLRFGEHLRRRRWLFAAVGVLAHLENLYLADLRPELVRLHPQVPVQVREFEARICSDIEGPREPWKIGVSVEVLRLHAPSVQELLDPHWLAKHEKLTGEGGRNTQVATRGFSVTWDSARLRTVFAGVVYE